MAHGDPFIEIIIPNWNGAKMLSHCLDSLEKQLYTNFSITVVDNGSSDHSLTLLEEDYPNVKVIRFDYNSGFSVAVNKGIESSEAPWLLLLNNDMEVPSDCLQNLATSIPLYSHCDFFSLKMLSYHDRTIIDGAGDAVLRGGVGYRLGTLEPDGERFSNDRDTFGACAGAALYKRTFFQKVGLFDADFFAYLEDVDLNIRARRLGLQCMYLSKAVVYHIGSATTGSKINEMTIRLSTRNNVNLLVKNYSFPLFIRFAPAILVYQLMWFLFCLKKWMVKPYFSGLYEACRMMPLFSRKRKDILTQFSKNDFQILGNLMVTAEREAVESIMKRRRGLGKNNFFLSCYCKIFL